MPGTVLVTGAGGFIGKALCRALLERGYKVAGAVRQWSTDLLPGVERRLVPDIGPDTDWRVALIRVDKVVHAAARVHRRESDGPTSLEAFRQVNTYGTRRLADACVATGVERFVFISSVKVLGDGLADGRPYRDEDTPHPRDAYGRSKAEAEAALRRAAARGLPVAMLRPPLVYGPGVRGNFRALLRACDTPLPLPVGRIGNRRSLLALGNLVDAIMLTLEHPAAPGGAFLLRDGEDLSTTDLVARTRKALGRPPRILPAPRGILRLLGRCSRLAGPIERITGSLTVDDSGIRQALDWRPPLTVDQGLQQTADWYRAPRS